MTIIDKAIAAVTPPVSEEKRAEARAKARAAAAPGDWLSQILDHHEGIESAFAAVRAAPDVAYLTVIAVVANTPAALQSWERAVSN
jgi:hypothetical protein